MKTISICIPTYEMKGLGTNFLEQSFDMLVKQTFQDFDVIISDHSVADDIENLCKKYSNKLTIYYYRNSEHRGSSSSNINNAIRKATGILIKILFQDDFLYHEKSLEEIALAFDIEKDHWLVSACIHTKDGKNFFRPFHPRYNKMIHLGNNTISSPSVLTIKNENPLFFDESLLWLMDVDYYRRCYDTFGEPKVLNEINVVNRMGQHQVSNTIADRIIRKKEYAYELDRYEHGLSFWYYKTMGFIKNLIK